MSIDGTDSKCVVCGNPGSPEDPVNVIADGPGENADTVRLCFDNDACRARIADRLESAEVSCVP